MELVYLKNMEINKPTYKIHGLERRKLKKELASLKSFEKNFWYFHQLDKDMASFFNSNSDGYPMNDSLAMNKYLETKEKITVLEQKLYQLYS